MDLIQAIWTGSAFLSWIAHDGVTAEMTLHQIQQTLRTGGDLDDIRRDVEDYDQMAGRNLPGRRRLMESEID